MADQTIDFSVAEKLGLNESEFEKIKDILGRTPNFTELSVFSVMWSEHCSYKNSIKYLKQLPRSGSALLVEAGEENAGLVDIGDGLACAFKIESHNHPSAIEPYQGAATGVGGIHRDIFTMGARPIAAMNSLRFGELDRPHTQHLVKGVVKGIGDYGNCLGVPTIGGETYFHPSYNQNILVNAFSLGIVKVGETVSATAEGVGNPVYIVGSATGKDGIHGATFASADLTEDSAKDLPAVQVGDPFQEKLLLEASLEAIQTGAIVGMQDMGAAGISCSTSEMSAKAGTGMTIDLNKVPTRQADMKPFEILLSESQERMLIVCKKGMEAELEAVFDKWDLECEIIGEVTDTGRLEMYFDGEKVVDVPSDDLVLGGGAPVYDREFERPKYLDAIEAFDINAIEDISLNQIGEITKALFGSPNLANKRWIYEQYDSMVRTNTLMTNEPSDANIIRLKGTDKSLLCSVDCNSSYVYADPYKGGMIAVSEAARNIVCSGGKPVAITNCLNFGNPYDKEVYWQFVHALKGMGDACKKFDTPVTGGNVSFYNQTQLPEGAEPIYPTPTIGMLGIMEDYKQKMTLHFKEKGHIIMLLGNMKNDLGQSEYLKHIKETLISNCPDFDLEEEAKLQKVVMQLISKNLIESAHDTSDGGLVIALMESCFHHGLGFTIEKHDTDLRWDAFAFGENQSRVIISVDPSKVADIEALCNQSGLNNHVLGIVTDGAISINHSPLGQIQDYKTPFEQTLDHYLN